MHIIVQEEKTVIKRETYLNWLIKHQENGLIKIISGVRRSGKSTLFELFKDHLKTEHVTDEQIIHLNFEDLRYYELRNFLSLNDYIQEKILKEQKNKNIISF